MRKSIWIVLALLVGAIGSPNASADTTTAYTVGFSGVGVLPTSPITIVYDNTTKEFTSFMVTWQGAAMDFAAALAAAPNVNSSGIAACGGPTSAATFLNGMTVGPCTFGINADWECATAGNGVAGCTLGNYSFIITAFSGCSSCSTQAEGTGQITTFSPVITTPEPSALALVLLGAGLVFVMLKRIHLTGLIC